MRRSLFVACAGLFLACVLCLPGARDAGSAASEIYLVRVSGSINPGTAAFVKKNIQKASDELAACCIIQLDTPGGLADSMRTIVMAILGSRVPVVVFVAPSGARAASAGVMITMAADVAAMASGTNIGAAHPVGAGGEDVGEHMEDKVTNDMVAYARSIAEKRGRNADWVEKAIRESVSITEQEAARDGVIDLVAEDLDDLLEKLDGRTIAEKGELRTKGVAVRAMEETLRDKVLKTVSDPNIAYILMMIGLAGLYFELSHPGVIFPGVIGAISLILAFFSFQTLPVNYAGILLILLSLVLFIMEMKIVSHGLLGIAGIVSFLLGSLMLFDQDSGMRVSWSVLIPTVATVSGFFLIVAGLVLRSQLSRPRTGAQGLVGEVGLVKMPLKPEGKVLVHGELWKAVSEESPVETGASVRIKEVRGLLLVVEPLG
ncbi:nodulation protein NfeD [Thermodesulfobacteriota bacterium]